MLRFKTTMLMEQAATAGLAWVAQVNVPWFLAGAMGVGVPAGIAAGMVVTENSHVFLLVSFMSSRTVGTYLIKIISLYSLCFNSLGVSILFLITFD